MGDSERIVNINVRSRWTVPKILLTSAVICISKVLHGKKIVQNLQTINFTKLTKAILKSSYRVLQVSPCLTSCIIFEENISLVIFY